MAKYGESLMRRGSSTPSLSLNLDSKPPSSAGGGSRRPSRPCSVLSLAESKDKAELVPEMDCSENHRLLHQHQQRAWLRKQGKYGFITFNDSERAELQRYFDALCEGQEIITMDSMEIMLISLGLANTREEVKIMVSKIDKNGNGELDFEEYLQVLMGGGDPQIFNVFKSMMDGKLGDRRVDFRNVISTFRRQKVMDATGARDQRDPSKVAGVRILSNFAKLERSRYEDKLLEARAQPGTPKPVTLPFDDTVQPGLGQLSMIWRSVKKEYNLFPEEGQPEYLSDSGPPPSPRAVIAQVTKGMGKFKTTKYDRTIMITQASAGDW